MRTAPSSFARRTSLAAIVAASMALGASAPAAFAQDGTGAATPTPPSACQLVPAEAADASATPATEDAPAATPQSGERTIPVVFIGGDRESDDTASAMDPLAQDLEAASTAITGCLSDGQYDTLVQIAGDEYLGQLIGLGAPVTADEFIVLAPMLPEVAYQLISVENAQRTSDTTATADVTYELAHQVRLSTWQFELQEIEGQQVWTLQGETAMTPVAPEGTDTLTVEIGADGYTIADATVTGPSVAIEASNGDSADHEVLVLRLDGATTADILAHTEPGLPEGVSYIGQATVPAGSSGTLLLSGLQPGTYTIVDLLPNAQGLPNLSGGMEITFEVE